MDQMFLYVLYLIVLDNYYFEKYKPASIELNKDTLI